jgi:nucleoporin SEH1
VFASISEDTRLKVWLEDPTSAPLSGRRFNCIFSQSPPHPSPYTALAFQSPGPTSVYLALATRNGLLSLLEPTDPSSPSASSDWTEIDSFWICNTPIPRGTETSFRLSFQDADRPSWTAIRAGLDPRALSLAVSALNEIKVYRITPHGWGGGEQYRFTAPVAELSGARAIVRDIAWCPATFRERDLIASAAADGYVRIYEVWAPKPVDGNDNGSAEVQGRGSFGAANRKIIGTSPSGIGAGLAGAEGKAEELEIKVPHHWLEVAELKHEGVWRVEWIRGGKLFPIMIFMAKQHCTSIVVFKTKLKVTYD